MDRRMFRSGRIDKYSNDIIRRSACVRMRVRCPCIMASAIQIISWICNSIECTPQHVECSASQWQLIFPIGKWYVLSHVIISACCLNFDVWYDEIRIESTRKFMQISVRASQIIHTRTRCVTKVLHRKITRNYSLLQPLPAHLRHIAPSDCASDGMSCWFACIVTVALMTQTQITIQRSEMRNAHPGTRHARQRRSRER